MPAAKQRLGPLAEAARKRLHRQIVAEQQAVEADEAANDLPITRSGERVAGRSGSIALDRRHARSWPPAGRRWRANGAKSLRSSSIERRVDDRQCEMAVGPARPWPGICFMTGRTPPSSKSLRGGAAEPRDGLGIARHRRGRR